MPDIIQATRAMGISKATHNDEIIDSDFDEDKWRKWIQKEEIIRFVILKPYLLSRCFRVRRIRKFIF